MSRFCLGATGFLTELKERIDSGDAAGEETSCSLSGGVCVSSLVLSSRTEEIPQDAQGDEGFATNLLVRKAETNIEKTSM